MHNIYPWQTTQWQYLLGRKQKSCLPHAILLSGIDGLGKLNFAKTLARTLLNTTENTHPDLFLIQPEEKSKLIKIDQIRELIVELTHTAQQGGNKVAIIEPAEMLNIAAANALLKTLEEPADNVFIVLVTAHPAKLPATIRSRCQQTILTAKTSIETPESDERKFFITNFLELAHNKTDPIKFAEACKDLEMKFVLSVLMTLISDLIKLKFVATKDLTNIHHIQALDIIAKKISADKLFAYFEKLLELNKYISQNINLNQQLALENLAIMF